MRHAETLLILREGELDALVPAVSERADEGIEHSAAATLAIEKEAAQQIQFPAFSPNRIQVPS
jgi:hypothetical protein